MLKICLVFENLSLGMLINVMFIQKHVLSVLPQNIHSSGQ